MTPQLQRFATCGSSYPGHTKLNMCLTWTSVLSSSVIINFAIHHFQKKSNLTIDLLSLGVYALGPQVLTYRFPAGTATPARSEILFGPVNSPKKTRGHQEMCGVGFRVWGIRK